MTDYNSEDQRIKEIFKGSIIAWIISAIIIVIVFRILNQNPFNFSRFSPIIIVLISVGILGGLFNLVINRKYMALGMFSSTSLPAIAYYLFFVSMSLIPRII